MYVYVCLFVHVYQASGTKLEMLPSSELTRYFFLLVFVATRIIPRDLFLTHIVLIYCEEAEGPDSR